MQASSGRQGLVASYFLAVAASSSTSWPARAAAAQQEQSDIADAMNSLYGTRESGVFLRVVGEGWTRPWEACENWDEACASYARVGRLSFLVLNLLYWNDRRGALMLPNAGVLEEGETADMGFIGTEAARLAATRCMFTVDGWTEFRFNDGCGCTVQSESWVNAHMLRNFSEHQTDGWQGDCYQPDNEAWCIASTPPRTVPLSSHTVGCPERFGCAWRASELAAMMRDYERHVEVIPRLCEQWNEVLLDAARWNAALPGGVLAFFIRKDNCMPGSSCYADFLRWTGEFTAEHGQRPVLELDVSNKELPFKLHVGVPSEAKFV